MPLHWEGGSKEAGFMIQLPIAADRIFFGTGSEACQQILVQMPAAEMIRRVNLTTLASASERIWGSTDDAAAHAFIEDNRAAIGTNVVNFRSVAPWAELPTAETR